MAKKQKEKQPPLPPPPPPASPSVSSSSSSSQDDEESPPPAITPEEKVPVASTATRLPKPPEPSSDSTGSDEEEDESSEGEEESKEVESSEDSGAAAAVKSNPPSLPQDFLNAIVKKTQNNAASSDLGSKDDEEDDEDDEDDEEEDSSSESDPSPPPPQSVGDAGGMKTATPIASLGEVSEEEEDDDESEDSSDSDETAPPPPPRSSSGNAADPSLKPLSSKPMDSPAQPAEKKPISGKRSVSSSSPASEKKRRTNDGVAVGGKEKKETFFKRIWSMKDELALLQGILDYKKQHHIIPSSVVLMDSLLESVKDSLSISVNRSRMHTKIRKLKMKYNNAAKRVKGDENPKFSNPHDEAVFILSKKIWGSSKEESQFPENKIKLGNAKAKTMIGKAKQRQSSDKYHSMQNLTKSKAPNIATLLPFTDMSSAIGGEFEGRCRKLEIIFLQLQGKKQKIYPDVLKIVEDALRK